jgi:hypothetical protein
LFVFEITTILVRVDDDTVSFFGLRPSPKIKKMDVSEAGLLLSSGTEASNLQGVGLRPLACSDCGFEFRRSMIVS